jgi:outer membrane protein TolC
MALPVRLFREIVLICFAAICLFTHIFASLVWADDRGDETRVTIVEAVLKALEDNHEIKAMKSSSMAQQQDIGIARSYLLPKISIEERYLRTNNPGYAFMSRLNQQRIETQDFNPDTLNHPDTINDYQSSVTIEQPIFTRRAFIGLDMSKNEAQAKNEEVKRKREEIAFHVVKACLTVVSAKEYVRVAMLGVADAQEYLRVADLRYKNEVAQYADSLRATTALTEARQKLNIAQKNVNLAKRGLGLLLAMTDPMDVDDSALDLSLRELSFYTKIADTRSDLRAVELRGENAKQNISMAEAGYFPYVGVGGTYQFNDRDRPFGSEGKSWQVVAFLRWELFDGTKREYERAKAKHQEAQSREYLSSMKKGVSFNIYEAYMNVEEARKNIELAQEALKTAEEGARLLKLRYENGLSSLSDLLNTQTSLEQARKGFVVHSNAYKVALAALSFESGTILRDLNIDQKVH